ncbi:MAG: hypothetical protein JETCAE01_11030 [Anaerolineaceae bacterium]|nr:MAG: hypothetical protein JETCAE01_11030 [Anaerolineaceae bacterium]
MSVQSKIPASRQKIFTILLILFLSLGAVLSPKNTVFAQTNKLESNTYLQGLLPQPMLQAGCASPANEIVAENCLTGNPPSEWDVSGAGDLSIQGFATDISVNRGNTVQFKIDTTAALYDIQIYRLGYYGGDGARLIHTITNVSGTAQPACTLSAIPIGGGSTTSGQLLDCGNWSVSASWAVPANATSGVYIARPTRIDNGGASHIVFIVRDDASDSDLLFQTSDTTWQSYNPYGGYNAYGTSGATVAEKLSYNRPFTTRGGELENWLFNAEYPMIRWLERNGYDVSYMSAVDVERYASLLLNHSVYMSVGHDEYWSQGRRDSVTAARNAGVNLTFFSGNEVYWKIRWEASTADGGSTDYRTQVVYKEGSSAPSGSAEHRNCYNNYDCDPSPIWTGQWREAPNATPENSLSGQISWRLNTTPITVPGEYAQFRFWRNTDVAGLTPAGQVTLADGTLGYEWDPESPQYADWYPAGRVLLSETTATSFTGIPEQHHMSLYRAASSALVFGAGTVQWSWGLDGEHDPGISTEDTNVQQATVNLFADMGVQPATLQANLTADTASTDTTPPTVTVTTPPAGSSVPGGPITITGTASDVDGVVGVVEISTNGGTTWRRATGRENWSYTYTAAEGTADIRVRAADDSINLSAPITHTFNVTARVCPCSIWNDTFTPTGSGNDAQPIEVGVKFQAAETGYITGLRFYKDPTNTGTHIGHLWANDGTQLAEATFTSETASGWQEVYFSTPIQIQANTTYVASYHSSGGGYSFDDSYFASEFNSAPLRALADGEDGPNGVYAYGASAFPTQTYQSANYWVDVIFDTTPQVYSVWEQGSITGSANSGDTNALEAGMKFRADVPGSVIGVTFYKGSNNTGPFLGHLWNTSGTQLAEKSFTNNTADEGWQEIIFDTPVPITANTTYIISYFTQSGNYSFSSNYFTADVYNPPLRALANGVDGPNGVYHYNSSGFPSDTYNASNYWVDVLFAPDTPIDNTPPTITSVSPLNGATNISLGTTVTATFNEAMDPLTLTSSTFELRDASNNLVPASVSYSSATRTATLTPDSPLSLTATYTARVVGGASGAADAAGNPLAANYNWSFSTLGPPPNEGPGGPILVLSSAANPFSRYYAEILRAEGLNEFTATDISNLTAASLNNYQVVILGEMTLTPTEVGYLTNWVNAGGNLIAMRPDPQLAGLLGLSSSGSTLSEGYLLVNTASAPGQGIVNQTMQYHGTADLYTLNGATSIATLYSNSTTATANPAVTIVNVGLNGGQAAAFTYDLARSVVYTRQGNPAWIDINGDGSSGPVRSDDLFHNGTNLDWVDLSKVAIPQADEQQRLLANMILSMNADENPLPRFWYFPRFEKAVVLMTADDHASANTAGRFDQYIAASSVGCSVNDWECIRSSIYIYPGSALSAAQATAYTNLGFEVGVHVDTGCGNFTLAQLDSYYTIQLAQFASRFPGLPQQDSERTHCIAWSNWAYQPTIKEQKGIRLDTNYYFWPPAWVNNTPGFFTGSGIPMRFADLDGTMFDVFQATTQMTDESGQSYPFTIDTLLNRAVGAEGYYGVFTANMHSDSLSSSGSDAIVASAQARDVPVVSGRQLLEWIDGRNFSAFSGITWNGNALDFHVSVGGGANGLYALLPTQSNAGPLQSITRNGTPVTYTTETVKGIEYAVFSATPSGDFQAVYSLDTTGPVISNIFATVNPDGTVTITWDTDEASDSRVDFGTDSNNLNLNSTDSALVTSHSITLTGLTPNTTYYFRVTSADASANPSTSPIAPATLDFTTPSGTLGDTLLNDFNNGTLGCTYPMQIGNGALILTPTIAAEFDGFVLPSGWSSNVWTGTAPTFGGGQVSLNGVSIRNDTLLSAGTSLEFTATFTNQSFQHVGFGGSDPTYDNSPWLMFSTSNDGAQLYARILANPGGPFNTGDDRIPLGAQYLGSPHLYRIDWNTNSVDFYIDGVLVVTRNITVASQMRVAASDYNFAAPALSVDWMHVSPYASPCTFTSQVFDAGQSVNWETLSWTGQTPTGTSFAFSYRIGNTPIPDGTWTSFTSVPTSGAALTGNTRYIQYQTVLATTNTLITPVLEDVSITYSLGADVTPPTIIGRDPAPNETDVDETTDITVTFSEPMDPTTILPANFTLIVDGPNTPVPFTLTYSGVTATLNPDSDLTPGTQYAVHVDGAVEDLAGNPLGTDSDWIFVTVASGLVDTTVPDFGSGTNACYIAETANGELILNPTVSAEFSGAALPAGWTSTPWTGGTSTVSGGQVTVDGALAYYSTSTFTPGRSMEFVATFTASQFQHVGMLGAADFGGNWAIFSTNNTTNQLYARTSDGQNTLIPGTWLGTPHRYRIDWTAAGASFYIDGAFYAQHNVALADMRPAISDFNNGGTAAIVDWIRMSPFGTPCAFESRIFDAGSVVDWQNLISTGSTPVGTNVAFETRTGNSSTPDVTWSGWESTSGVIASPNGQYAQYRVTLSTADVNVTPIIESVELTYLVVVNHAPTTSGIADVTVDEDASDSTLDLWTSFADLDEPDSALTYTIQTNTNAALFTSAAITGNQNLVLDFAPNGFGTADLTIRATDSGGLFVEDTFTVTVNPINDVPTTTGITNVTVDEDALDTTVDLFPSFADVEDADNALTYSVEANTNAALFTSVTITSGQNLVLDYAPNASGTAQITIRATDTGTAYIETTFNVTVNPVNDTPTDIALTNNNVDENLAIGTLVGTFSTTDVDTGDTFTYTFCGGTNDASFSLSGNQLLTAAVFNYEAQSSYSICIRSTDAGLAFFDETFTITVNNVNEAPTTSGIAPVSVDEDSADTTLDLWTSFADAEDADNALTYSIEANSNAALFTAATITGGQNLVLNYAPNASGTADITVRATDTGGLFVESTFPVTVSSVNDNPTTSGIANLNVNEDAADSTINLFPSFADAEDTDNQMTYIVMGNTNPALFTSTNIVGGQNLVLNFAPNQSGTADITIRATDTGGLFIETTFTVTVAQGDDIPTTSGIPNVIVNEDAPDTSLDLWTSFSDVEDVDNALTYTIEVNTNAGLFTSVTVIGGQNLVLDYAPNASGTADITVRATDTTNLFVETTFTVTVNPVDDNPTTSGIAPVTVNEDTADTSIDLYPSFADVEDTDAQMTYTVINNTNAALFTSVGIVEQNLILNYAPESSGTADITIRATDTGGLFVETTFTVTVNAVNDNPTTSGITNLNVNEDAADASIDLYPSFADVEDTDAQMIYTVTANTNAALFTSVGIVGQNLVLDFAPNTSGTADITVRATDTGSAFIEATFTVTVSNANDAPTDITLSNSLIDEGLPVGSLVGTLSTTDPDTGDTFTYSFCGGADDAFFQFNGSDLETAALLDADAQSSFTICIRSTDAGGASFDEVFVITINNINDAPVIALQSASRDVNENSPLFFNNAGNTRITINDADAGANSVQVSLSVSQGTLMLNSISGLTFTIGTGTNDASMTFTGSLANINSALDGMRYDPVIGFNGADVLQIAVDDLGNSGTGGAQTASASMDINVLNTAPMVLANGVNTYNDTGDGILSESEVVTANITQFIISFDQDLNASSPTDPDSVTNLNNFRLIHDNGNDFQTAGCDSPVSPQDIAITINSVVYDNNSGSGPFVVTLSVNDGFPLAYGNYRLYLCGTTSITDPTGLDLAGDGANTGTDFIRAFTIPNTTGGGGTGGGGTTADDDTKKIPTSPNVLTTGVLIPVTGFEPGVSSPLPTQTSKFAYTIEGDLRLEIPALSINQPIVGIPFLNDDWNVTWLGSRIGYLEGSAYPTWSGNTVLTGHATDLNGKFTSFGFIKDLKIGDKFMIHSNGLVYVYQIQQNRLISASSTSALFRHEEYDWVTLVTCEKWNDYIGKFVQRRIVRAALVSVVAEK